MKKFSYLLLLFFLLDGSMLKRFMIINEVNEAIKQRMNEGNTLNEAIDSVGHIHEIVKEYNRIWDLNKNRSRCYLMLYIMIGIITFILINDFIAVITGTIIIDIMTSSNSSVFIASKTNILLVLIKIVIELILSLFIAKKIIKHYICHRTE